MTQQFIHKILPKNTLVKKTRSNLHKKHYKSKFILFAHY